MSEINNAFKVKKGLAVLGDSSFTGNVTTTGDANVGGNINATGYITTPTLDASDNSNKVPTTAFVRTAIANLVNGSPAALDTLKELADALGDDPNFATTMTNQLSLKAPLNSPALTGIPTVPTASVDTNTTQAASTAFVLGQASQVAPNMDGNATVGVSTKFSREDHVHPTDTSRAPLASPALTGVPTAPTAALGTATSQLSTTAFVAATLAAVGIGQDAAAIPGTSTASIDDNTIPTGFYYVTSINTGTKPAGDTAGFLMVARNTSTVQAHQSYFDDTTSKIWSRAYASGAWTAWREVVFTDSPALTGIPTVPTAAVDTNTTQVASTAFVIGQAYAKLASPALTGTPTAPTASPNTNNTQIATTAYADAIAALKSNIANPSFTGTATFQNAAIQSATVSAGLASSDYTTISIPGGGSYTTTTASVTGSVKIKLPVSYTTTQVTFDVDVNETTTDSAFKLRVSGLNRASDNSWQTVTATVLGGAASRIPSVRFGNDGTTCCIWVGDLTDTWATPQISISNVRLGNSGISSTWMSGWSVSYVTSFDTVKTGPVTPLKAAGINSPTFTGIPTVPTAAVNTNNNQAASTAFVLGQAGTSTPTMAGTATVGTSTKFARDDHVHPTDTTRASLGSNTFTGATTIAYAGATLFLNDTSGTTATGVAMRNNGVNTWGLYSFDNLSGDFGINRYVSGSLADTPFKISTSTGVATFLQGPVVPTQAADTNTTQAASTAFVLGQASSTTPNMDGTAAVGTSLRYARADHTHPTDTTRAPIASPTFTGTVTLPQGSIAPGLLGSAANSVAAAGTTQGTATVLTNDINVVTSGTGGVQIPGAAAGKYVVVVNKTGSAINVYPASGHSFDSLSANTPISLLAGAFVELYGSSTTLWNTTLQAQTQAGFINGSVAIANGGTGATTAAGALTNLSGAQRSTAGFADGQAPAASLQAVDSRYITNPSTQIGYAQGGRFRFGANNDTDGTAGYADIIDLSTYTDLSGGGYNSLYLNKFSQSIVHKWALAGGTSWTARTLAYTDSPAFTGTPTVPTPAIGDVSTKAANTSFVQQTADNSAIVYAIVFG